MGNVIHLPVNAERSRLRLRGEGCNYALSQRNISVRRRETGINHGDLIGMDSDTSGETVTPRDLAISGKSRLVTKIDVERINRCDIRGGGGKQALRTGHLVRKAPTTRLVLVARRADGSGQIFSAPGQTNQTRMSRAVGAKRAHCSGCLRRDDEDFDRTSFYSRLRL